MSKVLAVIPARYSSTRFPGKPLAMIGEKPMVQWVYEAATSCDSVDRAVVATDDRRIADAVASFGGEVVLTSPDHATGTDRIIEVAGRLAGYDIIVNIQGDEPGMEAELIRGVIEKKREHPHCQASTAARPFLQGEDPASPNRVKVVVTKGGRALYFSRSLIPYVRETTGYVPLLHLGIYAYDRDFLMGFNQLPASTLERTEMLEQLRILENDGTIAVHLAESSMPGVDTPDDLEVIRNLFREKGLIGH